MTHRGTSKTILMPKKDGRKTLPEIKSDPRLRYLPVVILTTSKTEQDVYRSYNLGVNSFITKSVTLTGLVEAIGTLGKYWFGVVDLLPERTRSRGGLLLEPAKNGDISASSRSGA
jgi:response regulator RpfG family c-di-GMP phosphodiesterase